MRRIAAIAVTLLLAACSNRENQPPELTSIPQVRSSDGIAALSLDAVIDPQREAPAFSYGSAVGVAPTIRVAPGDTIRVQLHNAMPRRRDRSNDVNLHFHGLEVSPERPGDDVMTTDARPGQTLQYVVHVPKTQRPGLYWYHPHVHGSTYWQLTSGMSGAIVVEGLENQYPALRSMRERVIVLRELQDEADITTIPLAARPDALRNAVLAARRRAGRTGIVDDDDAVGQPCAPKPGMHTTINGAIRPHMAIAPGEREFFRVVNASAGRYYDLAVDGEHLELVALDGTALGDYPSASPTQLVSHIVIPPAGRAEFIVTGLRHATTLRSHCFNAGDAGDRDPPEILADLGGDGASDLRRESGPLHPARVHVVPLPRPAAVRTIDFTEDANGFYLGRKKFDMAAPPAIVAKAGTVEEWTLVNRTDEVHAFHVHQVHFAVESVNGIPPEQRHWLDVVTVPPQSYGPNRSVFPGTVRILVDFRDPVVRGTFVYHCHILDHEDGGMMATIRVI